MPIVRLPKGSLRDEIRVPLFDTLEIAASTSPVGVKSFFSSVQGKSRAKTNLRQNNLLETAVSYRVQGMAMDCQNFYEANVDCLPIILENSSIRVKIGEKDYWEGAMLFLSGRMEASYATGIVTVSQFYQKLGASAVQAVMLSGKHTVDINPLQSFSAIWTMDASDVTAGEIALATPAASTRLQFVFSFKGLLRRPVQ